MDQSKVNDSGSNIIPTSPANEEDFRTSIANCRDLINEKNKILCNQYLEIQNKIHSSINTYLNKFVIYKQRLSDYNEELEKLTSEELHLKSDKQDKSEQCEKVKQQLDKYHENIHNILQISELLEKNINLEEEKSQQYEKLLNSEQCNDEKIKEFDKAVSYFQSRLGLKLERKKDEELAFIFTHINPENSNEQYEFCINITDDNYNVTKCQPEIPEMKILLEKLNETNDLQNFVSTMREKFKELTKH